MTWQPIETAPVKDEFRCLVYSREMDAVMIGEWVSGEHFAMGDGCWCEVLGDACEYTLFSRPLTHWMPLPEPPG